MARAWRIEYEGALYHALSWGNERRGIFLDDGDRTLFLTGLAEAGERFVSSGGVLGSSVYHFIEGSAGALAYMKGAHDIYPFG